ncbi:leucine-rich repeat and immunoglobulin-like domain-containing nogo receptor-interacting protein 2 isoform X2 [Anthonomus grandis grandis]|nr:leucine-rich repeat and immunoglobulin-like domain-containing nogo receptor-interacting protein 2 isoform X2 [Anthonomus grandis grandis]
MELLWIMFFILLVPQSLYSCQESKKCKTTRVYGLKTSDCYNKDIKEFPKCLASNVEVIDLSYNRIRRISKDDLEQYPYITHLYLSDNLLTKLEKDTFSPLKNLQILDLSINDLSTDSISEVFQIPTLKALYLSQNINSNIVESIEKVNLSSQSTLTKLDISYITAEGSSNFPDLCKFPMIAFLNVTGNQFNFISTRQFAGLCNLQILVNVNMSANFENHCDCWNINKWLAARNVKFTAFKCPIKTKECMDEAISKENIIAYEKCRKKVDQMRQYIFLSKIGIWIAVAVIIILILATFYGYNYWSKYKRQKTET